MPELRPLHPVSLVHLDALSGDLGIMQHANGQRPDPVHGYCTDDVARALQVDLLHQRELGWDAVADSARRSLRFLDDAFDRTTKRFRNFRRMDGTWLKGMASADSQGRAMLALGETMRGAPDRTIADWAGSLFAAGLPMAQGLAANRARASVMLGCDAALAATPSESILLAYGDLTKRLRTTFESGITSTWPWPEPRVTYENALLARALIVAGGSLDSRPTRDLGLRTLDWLLSAQTDRSGHFAPVGNGWWPRDGERSRFDQQPIEATATLLAADAAYECTGDDKYRAAMERSYGWFLGENDLGVDVAEPGRGASYDGLTPTGVNMNQGAESTLMWLIALEHIRAMRARGSTAPTDREAVLMTSSR